MKIIAPMTSFLKEQWKRFSVFLGNHEKKSLKLILLILILLVGFSASLVFAKERIRESELKSLVTSRLESKHIRPLEYGKEAKKIKEARAISVMFSKPHGETYKKVLGTIKDSAKEAELNRSFYYYPLVYDSQTIAKDYQLDPEKVTFVFFEKGKEKNRFVVEELEDYDKEFIPELNRLPMWNIKKFEEEQATQETAGNETVPEQNQTNQTAVLEQSNQENLAPLQP